MVGSQEIADEQANGACADWVVPPELAGHWPSPNQSGLNQSLPTQNKQRLLASVIENEVLPRLLLANRRELALAPPASDLTALKLAERIDEFCELVIHRDAQDSIAYFNQLRDQGVSIEALYQDLLAPAARRLGKLWEEDINDFMDVTRGVGHLQEIIRAFGTDFSDEASRPISSRRALLMPLPGEQHTLGISLLREHFLREGWRVWCGPCTSFDNVVKLVKGQWFDMVGLSASVLADPVNLATRIRKIRKASLNKKMAVFVGGQAFSEQPSLVAAVGADATASNGRQAVLNVTKLIGKGDAVLPAR